MIARGNTCVYVCRTNSVNLHASAYDNARVGLAGVTQNFYLDASENTCVGARNLCAESAYVRTSDKAHVNVSSSKQIFASADGSSSIYFFGSADSLTRFVSESGFVMRICTAGSSSCPILQKVTVACPKEPPLMLKGAG